MMTRLPAVLLLCCLTLVPGTAAAQERGQVGVAMGYPTTFAFVWHVSDTLAVRPELSFVHSSSDTESSVVFVSSSSSDTWNATVGASALWYLRRIDSVRTYFSPRIAFGHTSTEASSSDGIPRTSSTVSASGSFGAQYAPVRKFSVYGEIGYGLGRGWSELKTPILTSKSTGWNWSPRTSVGVIFYLGRS